MVISRPPIAVKFFAYDLLDFFDYAISERQERIEPCGYGIYIGASKQENMGRSFRLLGRFEKSMNEGLRVTHLLTSSCLVFGVVPDLRASRSVEYYHLFI